MNFIEISVSCSEDFVEILMAEISQLGYDSIMETDSGFNAYIDDELFDRSEVEALFERYESAGITFEQNEIKRENWNADWEENYDPIIVQDNCIVRAPFHELDKGYEYDIIITPKMSFGTGHHETTHQVLSLQMNLDHRSKKVMDAGCGTGILSVMAEKLGASCVDAFDIDEWCVENSEENFQLNHSQVCSIQKGTINEVSLENSPYDIVIANINKNILLNEMPEYANKLSAVGDLLLSGFYENDLEDIKNRCSEVGLAYHRHTSKNNWVAAHFVKEK